MNNEAFIKNQRNLCPAKPLQITSKTVFGTPEKFFLVVLLRDTGKWSTKSIQRPAGLAGVQSIK